MSALFYPHKLQPHVIEQLNSNFSQRTKNISHFFYAFRNKQLSSTLLESDSFIFLLLSTVLFSSSKTIYEQFTFRCRLLSDPAAVYLSEEEKEEKKNKTSSEPRCSAVSNIDVMVNNEV